MRTKAVEHVEAAVLAQIRDHARAKRVQRVWLAVAVICREAETMPPACVTVLYWSGFDRMCKRHSLPSYWSSIRSEEPSFRDKCLPLRVYSFKAQPAHRPFGR